MSRFILGLVTGLTTLLCGCQNLAKSRYAMDDPVYAAKYEEGAERGDMLGKLKQAIDARHVSGLGGSYLSGGAQWRNEYQSAFAGAEVGYEYYPVNWFSSRLGLAGFVGHGDWYAGLDYGARLQLPSRLTPFVGVGTFHGLSTTRVSANDDGIDNDDDGVSDEFGEEDTEFDGWLSTVYPEAGVHFWPTGQSRISAFSRYLVSSEGRAHDDWLFGLQLTAFSR